MNVLAKMFAVSDQINFTGTIYSKTCGACPPENTSPTRTSIYANIKTRGVQPAEVHIRAKSHKFPQFFFLM